jgi:hypothetical protein
MKSVRSSTQRRWGIAAACLAVAALVGGGAAVGAASNSSAALDFHVLTTPVRVMDTRSGTGGVAKHPLAGGKVLDLTVPNLPSDTKAVSLNVTVVNGTVLSHLSVYSPSSAVPKTSAVNWSNGSPVANSIVVPVAANHRVRFANAAGSVNIVVDLLGYYTPASGNGVPGVQGAMGPQGPAGGDGPMGLPGRDGVSGGADAVYSYASNASSETIHRGGVLTFDTAGPHLGVISFASGTGAFTVGPAGVYKVTFWALADDDNQFDLRVNGQVPTTGMVIFGALAHTPTSGTAVLNLDAGDVVTLQNTASIGAAASVDDGLLEGDVRLSTQVGGASTASMNASIIIEQLNASVPG